MDRTHRPSPALIFSLITSGTLLVGLSLWVRDRPVQHWERDLFALLNHLPPGLTPVLVAIMQLGNYLAVFVAALGALVVRRVGLARDLLKGLPGLLLYGLPAEVAVAGVLVYRLATFWLPALPGYVALRVLVRRRLL